MSRDRMDAIYARRQKHQQEKKMAVAVNQNQNALSSIHLSNEKPQVSSSFQVRPKSSQPSIQPQPSSVSSSIVSENRKSSVRKPMSSAVALNEPVSSASSSKRFLQPPSLPAPQVQMRTRPSPVVKDLLDSDFDSLNDSDSDDDNHSVTNHKSNGVKFSADIPISQAKSNQDDSEADEQSEDFDEEIVIKKPSKSSIAFTEEKSVVLPQEKAMAQQPPQEAIEQQTKRGRGRPSKSSLTAKQASSPVLQPQTPAPIKQPIVTLDSQGIFEESNNNEETEEDAPQETTGKILPRQTIRRLIAKADIKHMASDILDTAEEVLAELISDVVINPANNGVITGGFMHKLINNEFRNEEDELPDEPLLTPNCFQRFITPILQSNARTIKRDAVLLLHLYAEAYLVKMVRAADMVASASKRSRVCGDDLTVAFHIHTL